MKIYLKRNEGSHPLGLTTKKADSVEWEGGNMPSAKAHSVKIKGTSVCDTLTLPKSWRTNEFIVWKKEPVDNPYYNDDNAVIGENWISKKDWIIQNKKLPEQTIAEIKFDQPKGFFTEKSSWGDNPKKTIQPTYFETLQRKFYDTTTFDDEHGNSPMADYIWIRAILRTAEEFVESDFARNKADIANKPRSKYFVYDEVVENQEGYVKEKPKLKVYSYVYEVTEKWNQEQCYKLATMISNKYPKATKVDRKLPEGKIKTWLSSFINNDVNDQNLRWQLFVEVYERMTDKLAKKAFEHEFFIVECINYKVLTKQSSSPEYSYYVDGNKYPIGSMEALLKLEDKAILATLETQLKAKLIES